MADRITYVGLDVHKDAIVVAMAEGGIRGESGTSIKRGGLTKAGNSAARRLLIEAAWSYRFPARVSRELLLRQEKQPKPIRDIAWKGQVRLCARYRRLARTGKPANIVTTAIARELSGFVWAIARQVAVMAG
jgi:transposase